MNLEFSFFSPLNLYFNIDNSGKVIQMYKNIDRKLTARTFCDFEQKYMTTSSNIGQTTGCCPQLTLSLFTANSWQK